VTAVGRITPGKGVVAIDARGKKKPLPVRGYEHFRTKRPG
jgi:thiamine monophosphate kinase